MTMAANIFFLDYYITLRYRDKSEQDILGTWTVNLGKLEEKCVEEWQEMRRRDKQGQGSF